MLNICTSYVKSRRKKERKKEKNWSRKENIAAPVIEYHEGKWKKWKENKENSCQKVRA